MPLQASRVIELIHRWMKENNTSEKEPLKPIRPLVYAETFGEKNKTYYEAVTSIVYMTSEFTIYFNSMVSKKPDITFNEVLNFFVANGTVGENAFILPDYGCEPHTARSMIKSTQGLDHLRVDCFVRV